MKLVKNLLIMVSAILFLVIFTTCEDDISGGSTTEIVFPDSNVSYGRHVQPLFDRGCAFSGCHIGVDPPMGLNLETYQNTMSADVVFPGDPEQSRLIWRVEGWFGLVRMPLMRPPLTKNQKEGLKTWIREGAQNN